MTILGSVETPAHWEYERLDHVLARSRRVGEATSTPLSVFLIHGVVPRSDRAEENHNRLGEDLSKYLLVRPGDVVFNKLRTWQGGLGVADHHGIVSPAYFVCQSTGRAVPRFLHHLLRSKPYLDEFTRVSKWMPPSQFDITWDQLRRVPVLLPPLEDQQAIADFLDAETARIDQVMALRGRQIALMKDRWRDSVTAWVATADIDRVTFGRFIQAISQGVSPVAEDRQMDAHEWGVLKLSAIKNGRFWPNEHKALADDFDPRGHLKPLRGSLLVTRANTPALVAEACSVDEEPERMLLSDLIYRIDLDQTRMVPEFAAAVLGSRQLRDQLSSAARGTSQTMVKLRSEDIRAITMPVPMRREQRRLADAWQSDRRAMDKIAELIRMQVALLRERRQALIAAAVTGEIDVSTASGRGGPA